MNILYLAKHNQQNNDDEKSIELGLLANGANVVCLHSNYASIADKYKDWADYVLIHKETKENIVHLYNIFGNKIICWFFDPIYKGFQFNDDYVNLIIKWCKYVFLTDGDFVKLHKNDFANNIYLLRQGLHQHNIEKFKPPTKYDRDLLFIGTVSSTGYIERKIYLNKLIQKYGHDIAHTQYNVFKDDLTNICQNTKMMLALPPVTDNYWSNRIYVLGGRGAFVLHPYSSELEKEFGDSLVLYKTPEHLIELIEYFKDKDQLRNDMQIKVQDIVINNYTYRHRCKQLMDQLNG